MSVARPAVLPLVLIASLLAAPPSPAQTTYRWIDKASGRTVFSDLPPPPGVTPLQVRPGESGAETPLAYATRVAAEKYPVTLYTMARCVEPCRLARELLNGRGIPFVEKLVDTPEQQDELAARLGSEDISIPSLFVGTQAFRGFEAGAWNNLLDLAGYPASAPFGARPSGVFAQ